MKIVNTAIAAAMLSSSVMIGSGVASAASFQAPPAVENAGVTEAHYRHRHRYHRCYTTLVKRYHHWVRVTRCRW